MVLPKQHESDAHVVSLQIEQHMGEDALLLYVVHCSTPLRPAVSFSSFSQEVYPPY